MPPLLLPFRAYALACFVVGANVQGLALNNSSFVARANNVKGEGGRTLTSWPVTPVPLSSPPLRVLGEEPPRGIFDPSLLTLPDLPSLLSYSAVTATDNISTHLAVNASDGGGSFDWKFMSRINTALVNVSLPCAGGPCLGSFIHETPSIVSVPNLAGDSLHVFTHSYVVTADGELHYDWGHISLWTAPLGTGPWQGGPLLGWAGASPLSTDGVAVVLTDVPALTDCLLFCEPGAASDPKNSSRTLLALGCATPGAGGGTAAIRIILLASTDAALRSWTYVSTLVDGAADASRLGYAIPQLNAADLFAAPSGDELLLSVSPAAEIFPALTGYAGCLILGVLSDGSGVARNASGAPIVLREVSPASPAFAGACTAATGVEYLLPVLDTLGAFFTIRSSGQSPV